MVYFLILIWEGITVKRLQKILEETLNFSKFDTVINYKDFWYLIEYIMIWLEQFGGQERKRNPKK